MTKKRKTTLSETIEGTQGKRTQGKMQIQYDNACKKLLSEKIILAWIMKQTISEYQNIPLEDIKEKYIQGTPIVSKIPVMPDAVANEQETIDMRSENIASIKEVMLNQINTSSQIYTEGTEDTTITEGTVFCDIRFQAMIPKTVEVRQIIINLEAQNDFYPGYPIITRGIYYTSRLMSSQYGKDFIDSNYQNIKKVYSIWICINPPNKRKNTITQYRMNEENIIGKVKEKKQNYDLLTTMMICLGNSEKAENELLELLDILLTDDKKAEVKKQELEEKFGIKMTQDGEREVNEMSNLGEGLVKQAMKRGIKQGVKRGKQSEKISIIIKKIRKGKPFEIIAEELECEPEEIYDLYQAIKEYGTECDVTKIVRQLEKKKI